LIRCLRIEAAMNLEGPVEVVFDTSVIIGAILESWGEEHGQSREAFNSIVMRRDHILRFSDAIIKECIKHFHFKGIYAKLILTTQLGQLEPGNKIKKCSYRSEDIQLEVPVLHEEDRPVLETAVAIKRRGITICLVHKNPRHFNPISGEMQRHHGILVRSAGEYIDP
jgi:predicted nucleic acid-binding protein